MTNKEGPMTERQTEIIEMIADGNRHKAIAKELGIGLSVTRQEVTNFTVKFGAETSFEAVAKYSRAKAYQDAADELRKAKVPVPIDATEMHVNHVLDDLVTWFEDLAFSLVPK